ncbi:MAG: PDZ domain-containing protein [Verrucomicrobia bacterium]|nr:MAG: PDZ domain-containing protein [Verrucomicrobiota bacterium]
MKAMKANFFLFVPAIITALLAPTVVAIEPPADNAPPPPAAAAPAAPAAPAKRAAAPAAAKTAPYLGIGSGDVPEVLATHLGLKAGAGIVIRALDPDGPGAKAGLTQHDVITRIAGQVVGSQADLVKQIRSHQTGDEITVDLIHHGQPATKSITLAARPDGDGVAAIPQELDTLMLDGMPQEQAKRIRDAIGRQLRAMQNGAVIPEAIPGNDLPKMGDAMKEMQKRVADALKNGMQAPGGLQVAPGGVQVQGAAIIRMADDQGSIELKSADGGKEATLRDKDNKVTWTGPWDTEQDKAAAPPAVRSRLENLNLDNNLNGNGLHLQFGGNGGAGPLAPMPDDETAPEEDAPDE